MFKLFLYFHIIFYYITAEEIISKFSPPIPSSSISSGTDPCLKDNHEIILDETLRSFNQPVDEDEGPICDKDLKAGWYQFQSLAGNTIPTGCPALNHCGTQFPIWLKGDTPKVTEGIVNSHGCVHIGEDCCAQQMPILLKNCSNFLVYFLQPTHTCDMAYCAGYMVPCPLGLESDTGFTPCQFLVEILSVEINAELNKANNIEVRCSADIINVKALETIKVEIEWLKNGDTVIFNNQYYPADEKYAILPRKLWSLGDKLRCRAKVRHISINTFTKHITSDEYFAGIEITSPPYLTLLEGGSPVTIDLLPTLPVGCPGNICCINIQVEVLYPNSTYYCPTGQPLDRVGLPDCLWRICNDDWNITHKIPLVVKYDNFYGGNQELIIKLQTYAPTHSDWQNYELPEQKAIIVGEDVSEKCSSGALIHTFDGLSYSHNIEGSFMLYKNDIQEVIVTYKKCSYRKLCNCAVRVHAKYSTFVADYCSRGYVQVWSDSNYSDDSVQDITIIQENEGRTYKLILPSGTMVTIGSYLSVVTIHAFASDFGKTSGLCASFDRDNSNDFFSHEDNTNLCIHQPKSSCNEFSQLWRINDDQLVPPEHTYKKNKVSNEKHCSCRRNNFDEDKSRNKTDLYDTCDSNSCLYKNGIEMSEEYLKFTALEFFSPNGEEYVEDITNNAPYELSNIEPPNGEWTFNSALQFCKNFISNNEGSSLCQLYTKIDVNQAIQDCAMQIAVTNHSGWAAVNLNNIKYECQIEIYRNLSLWEERNDGKIIAPSKILSNLCLNNCSNNGICKNGICNCNTDFVGSDCSVDNNEAPRITKITENPCDVQQHSCKYIAVSGSKFAEHQNLRCNLEVFTVKDRDHSTISHGVTQSSAEFLSYQVVICTLPDLLVHTVGKHFNKDSTRSLVKVGVCYGEKCSNSINLWVIDSRCWNCSLIHQNHQCEANLHGPCFYYNPFYTPLDS